MYTYFSHFLHHTLSCPNAKPQSTSMLSYSGLTGVSRWGKFATWFDLDSPIKSESDRKGKDAATCRGRSMVEMLGVLAIIGVLSVGAISGYSKAMFKYKLNKQAESFNSLLNSAIQLYPDLTRTYNAKKFDNASGVQFVLNVFGKMNLIPDSMSIQNNYIVDIFKNHIWFSYYNSNDGTSNEYLMYVTLARTGNTLSDHDKEVCRNMVTVAKENSENLAWLEMRSYRGGTSSNQTSLFGGLADLFLSNVPKNRLLRNAGVKEIDDFCSACNSEETCQLIVYINVTSN
jgi:type II secretory pathway pseudopilin PulG